MVLGRARFAAGGALAALIAVLACAGCGTESHKNEPRPAISTRVSVVIGKGGVIVMPGQIGIKNEKFQQLPQNQNQQQPAIKTQAPMNVVFVTANQTGKPIKLRIKGGGKDATSQQIDADSPGTYSTDLATGNYTITATGAKGGPAKLKVGPFRSSTKNDLLLP